MQGYALIQNIASSQYHAMKTSYKDSLENILIACSNICLYKQNISQQMSYARLFWLEMEHLSFNKGQAYE